MAACWQTNRYLKRNHTFPTHSPVAFSPNPHLCPSFPSWVMHVQYSEGVQYGRGYSVRQRDIISAAEISYMHVYDARYFQYCGVYSVHQKDIISAMGGYYEYYGEILSVIERYSVLMRAIISTVESIQYSGISSINSTEDIPLWSHDVINYVAMAHFPEFPQGLK